jgi:hypothetical protein
MMGPLMLDSKIEMKPLMTSFRDPDLKKALGLIALEAGFMIGREINDPTYHGKSIQTILNIVKMVLTERFIVEKTTI